MLHDVRHVPLHPGFPVRVWAVVEQPPDERHRLDFNPTDGHFSTSTAKSLLYDRGWPGGYGWVGGLGTPPSEHVDIILITHHHVHAGDVVLAHVCGMFYRADSDHKVVGLDDALLATVTQPDLTALDAVMAAHLRALYPRVGSDEGWLAAEEAQAFLRSWVDGTTFRPSAQPVWGPSVSSNADD